MCSVTWRKFGTPAGAAARLGSGRDASVSAMTRTEQAVRMIDPGMGETGGLERIPAIKPDCGAADARRLPMLRRGGAVLANDRRPNSQLTGARFCRLDRMRARGPMNIPGS